MYITLLVYSNLKTALTPSHYILSIKSLKFLSIRSYQVLIHRLEKYLSCAFCFSHNIYKITIKQMMVKAEGVGKQKFLAKVTKSYMPTQVTSFQLSRNQMPCLMLRKLLLGKMQKHVQGAGCSLQLFRER